VTLEPESSRAEARAPRPRPGAAGPPRARVPLSVPHLAGGELQALEAALASNWIASVGPDVDRFEAAFAEQVGASEALATTSGTAALHLALRVLGVGPGDEVLVSTFTFCASVNPALYLGARPVFVDSEGATWNLDPELLAGELDRRGKEGRLPAAVVVVHVYGQLAQMEPILAACRRWGVPVVEDAAEALGGRFAPDGRVPRHAGTLADVGIFSFDGSKMITTSMGGMLVSDRGELVQHARKLARQAREPVPHYEHVEVGYNYRMSNLLAAVGCVQLPLLETRVAQRRAVADGYRRALEGLPGISFQPDVPWATHARWLTCIRLDPALTGTTPARLRQHLLEHGIESRAVWKPLHLQPVYRELEPPVLGGNVSETLFREGLCLPSSSSLTPGEVAHVAEILQAGLEGAST
jgi:dTDP-4-amino-4,6-dideoxygalactose transaminase